MWKLVIEDDEGKRTVVPLTRDDYTIGRQEGNTIRLTERNVSREHGRIKRKRPNGAPPPPAGNGVKDNFVLEDRSSYNGLFVNGLRVAHTQDLQHGDLIQIGDYRIVLQDDAASSIETAAIPVTQTEPGHDVKATIPMAAAFRGQDLTERPSRFVMLVGPTPGVEYPLDRERMTIGRAEDSSISVNHNSVSRLHCEVHALGDGRYEIVDKGSSNGVRVNAVELKRSIIEAGDVIELGDVRFKFVGAGQIFVPGPNESQQLTAISDRDAELADPRRKSWGGYALPIVGAGVVGALIILAFVYVLRTRANADTPSNNGNITAPSDGDLALVMEAKKTCTTDECDAAYALVSTLPEKSLYRDSIDFRQIEALWAESMIKKEKAEADPSVRRALLNKISQAKTLDEAHKKLVAQELAALDQPPSTPSQLPTVLRDPLVPPSSATPPPNPTRTTAPHPTVPVPPTATVPASATAPKPPQQSAFDRASLAAREGRDGDVRAILDGKVRSGKGNADEVNLLRQTCKKQHDTACLDDIKSRSP
jgi:ABC transport system ATP-binding/permease protein